MDANEGMLPFDNDATGAISHAMPVSMTGYKTARVRMHNGQIMMSALTVEAPIPFDADAHCDIWSDAHRHYQDMLDNTPEYVADLIPPLPQNPPHEVPSELCTCGFYAYAEPDSAIHHDQNDDRCVLVEVAISGKYLWYENGYRYAHQRVKTVHIGGCMSCSATPVGMTVIDDGWMRPVCVHHMNEDGFTLSQMSAMVATQVKEGYAPVEFLAGSSAPEPAEDLMAEIMQLDTTPHADEAPVMRHTLLPLVGVLSMAVVSIGGVVAVLAVG